MIAQASKIKQEGTNSIGMRPSCVLRLFVCVSVFAVSPFCLYFVCERHAVLQGDTSIKNVEIGITSVDFQWWLSSPFLYPSSLPYEFIALSHSPSLYHPAFSYGEGAWDVVIDTYRQQRRLNDALTPPTPSPVTSCIVELFDLSDPGAIPSMWCKSSQAYTSSTKCTHARANGGCMVHCENRKLLTYRIVSTVSIFVCVCL